MIAVCVCTYKRRASLLRLLKSLLASENAPEHFIVVVDNDGTDHSVEEMVRELRSGAAAAIHYFVETTPGISAARNRAVKEASSLGANFVAMIDDDEWVTPVWLSELVKTQETSKAAVVGGPVEPVFSDKSQAMKKYAQLWAVKKDFLNGRVFVFCTCNFLARMDAIASLGGEPFDEAYGISGGGDTVFFRRLFRDGWPMAWADGALIQEEMPNSRANLAWLRQRRYRAGNVSVRWERDVPVPPQLSPLLKTILTILKFPVFPLTKRGRDFPLIMWLLEFDRIRGRIAAHIGVQFDEYKRAATPPAR